MNSVHGSRPWAAGTSSKVSRLLALSSQQTFVLLDDEGLIAPLTAELLPVQRLKFARAVDTLRLEGVPQPASPAMVSPNSIVPVAAVVSAGGISTNNNPAAAVPAEQHIVVPEYGSKAAGDPTGAFAELQASQARRVYVLGHSFPVQHLAAGTGALLVLVVVVLVLVGSNSAHDSCVDVHCGTYGSCQSGACVCQPGYSGTPCAVDICYEVNCGAHGSCYVSNEAGTEHACRCAGGWKGRQCDQVDPCYQRCGVHGTCAAHGTTATCTCAGGYSGDRCQLDPCHGVDCGVGVCQGAQGLACKHTCHLHT
jgi:hypothetical protein